jgi:hypothetical protein
MKSKGVGFFGRKFVRAYGRDNAVWASVAIYVIFLLTANAAMEKYNPIAPRPRRYNVAVVAVFFCIAFVTAALVTYKIMILVFDAGSGVTPRAGIVFCHALAAGVAYLAWGLVDRCVRSDAPRIGEDGKDICGGEGVCKRVVHSALIPLAVLACDLVFFGVALAAAGIASSAGSTGVVDAGSTGVVDAVVAYAKVALFARGVLEVCKLVFDYEATLVASVDDPGLQDDLLACHSKGSRQFGTCSDAGGEAAGPGGASGGGISAPKTGTVSVIVLRLGVRRALLETAVCISAFAALVFVYNLVPDAASATQRLSS